MLLHLTTANGAYVAARELAAESGGGVCCWVGGGVPVIFIDPRMEPWAQLQVLAHELGHAHRGPLARPATEAEVRAEEDACTEWGRRLLAEHGVAWRDEADAVDRSVRPHSSLRT